MQKCYIKMNDRKREENTGVYSTLRKGKNTLLKSRKQLVKRLEEIYSGH